MNPMGRPQGSSIPDFESISAYLASGKYPDYMRNDRGKKVNFRRQASSYVLRSGLLFRKHRPHRHGGIVLELRVVTERKEREWILRACHEGTNGTTADPGLQGVHVGQGKTCARILERFWWPGVSKDIINFIRTCPQCHKAGLQVSEDPSETSSPVPALPWNRVIVDLVSLPRTAEGYVGVGLAVDCHSKWVEAEPLRGMSVECVSGFLCRLVSQHGCAYDVQIKNQSQEFVDAVSMSLFNLIGLKQKVTAVFDFSPNRHLEVKACGFIQDCLVRILKNKHEDWPKALPGVLFAHRISKLEQSEHTPFYLMYRRQPYLAVSPALAGSTAQDSTPTAADGIDTTVPLGEPVECEGSADVGGLSFVEGAVDERLPDSKESWSCGDGFSRDENCASSAETSGVGNACAAEAGAVLEGRANGAGNGLHACVAQSSAGNFQGCVNSLMVEPAVSAISSQAPTDAEREDAQDV